MANQICKARASSWEGLNFCLEVFSQKTQGLKFKIYTKGNYHTRDAKTQHGSLRAFFRNL